MNDLSLYTSLARSAWHKRRLQMETSGLRHTRGGALPKVRLMRLVTATVRPLANAIGLGRRAAANALDIGLTELDLFLPSLPATFDGYRILLLADIHVGRVPGLVEHAASIVRDVPTDLAVMAGDIQTLGTPAAVDASRQLAPLIDAIDARDGVLAVLGNHDAHDLVEAVELLGVRMLVNEHHTIERSGAAIRVTGLDDVNYFYTEEAEAVLRSAEDGPFSIALVHSPEMADVAAEAGYGLYLSGHTHGGQVCLPGGRPLYTAISYHRHLATGAWTFGDMLGYTSRGAGVARPVRFNCPPEVTLLRLRCEPAGR